jgi:hypothetical protein
MHCVKIQKTTIYIFTGVKISDLNRLVFLCRALKLTTVFLFRKNLGIYQNALVGQGNAHPSCVVWCHLGTTNVQMKRPLYECLFSFSPMHTPSKD